MALLDIILRQNYFSFQGQIYQPDKSVAMGSPISGTMAEVFLQQLEKSIIKHLIDAKILSFYTRYIDDIFLIYDSTCPNCNTVTLSTGASNLVLPWNPTTISTS